MERARRRRASASTRRSIAFVVEPKIDGLALSITYVDGALVQAATRGDGRVGRGRHRERAHDRQRARDAQGHRAGRVEVRGEVFLARADFVEMNRTAARGSV